MTSREERLMQTERGNTRSKCELAGEEAVELSSKIRYPRKYKNDGKMRKNT